MEIIFSKQCESLTGSIGNGFGYHIQRRTGLNGKTRFWGVRQSNGEIPADGHWRFIVACAVLAQNMLYITDIKVGWLELQTALYEAKCFTASEQVRRNYADNGKATYYASDILNLKTKFGL